MSLFQRLGGQASVDAVVETFYQKVLADDRVSQFFANTDMERQIAKQRSFLTMVFGGPSQYTGLNMRQAHRRLVAQGLTDHHVDAVIELLESALRDHGVDQDDILEVTKIANSVRNDVLNR